jgi:type II secretory pathway predicted ATPase ExeA
MYCEYFGLRDYPFLSTADRRFFYISEGQSQAKNYLQYLLEIRDGIVVLTGVPGSGKTVLLEQLLHDIPGGVSTARIQHTLLNDEEFLFSVCMQLECIPKETGKPQLFNAIRDYAMDQHLAMKPVLLVVEDAQNLNPRILEEIRQLAGLEMFGRKLIQLILVGQPELDDILADMPNEALAQHIRLQHRLKPLGKRELSEYIDYRLYVAGNDGRIVFPSELMQDILAYTGGIPRLINQLCDMMLVTAFINHTDLIDSRCLRSSVQKLGWPLYAERRHDSARLNRDDVDMRPVPLLTVHNGDSIVGKYLLNKKRMLIGRSANAEIVIDDPAAGRIHAQLVNMDKQFFIHDLNNNGETSLNDQPVKWRGLSDGDVLQIGNYTMEYQLADKQLMPQDEQESAAIA